MPIPYEESQKLEPSSVIDLWELQLFQAIHDSDTLYRFHAGINAKQTGNVVWAGNSYQAWDFAISGFDYNTNGPLPRPTATIGNVNGTISALVQSLPRGLSGAQVKRRRTYARYLDAINFPGDVNPHGTPDPTWEWPAEIYTIDQKKSETREAIVYDLACQFDLAGVRVGRQMLPNYCGAIPARCQFAASCGKRLADCKANWGNATLPYEGYPGMGTF